MKTAKQILAMLMCLIMMLLVFPCAMAEETVTDPTGRIEENIETPAFLEYGLDVYLKDFTRGKSYDYRTSGYNYGERLTKYKAKADAAARWAVFYEKGTEKSEADLSGFYFPEGAKLRYVALNKTRLKAIHKVESLAGEGYEWRGLECRVKYSSFSHGYSTVSCMEDYYNIILHDDTQKLLEENTGEKSYWSIRSHHVKWNGEERVAYCYYASKGDGNGNVTYDYFIYAPKGYDGAVFGLLDGRKVPEWEDDTYVFDYVSKYTLMFRLA